ncbi:type II toxin-antitoxin system HicA family toxin [Hydromonas duriensis]|uniref:Putative RNA binding protein YcfA (HicA-like mRNA interferase family) n=1 Tax=Hydromonas duriensis TaxID=1527608 RepID=A0A4R6Y3Y5_9BURK|nr:type II toxin-antitoxin system HicA family toxin [Hydromonas duriensis]TDR27784.1 putative RNA binding protein YcfA (HicA-like mRNA interferase family) [Hydromonas duriensis]
MNGYYQQLIKLLKSNGYIYLRQGKGSHEMWGRNKTILTVPFNCKSRHTANAILKDAGIKERV